METLGLKFKDLILYLMAAISNNIFGFVVFWFFTFSAGCRFFEKFILHSPVVVEFITFTGGCRFFEIFYKQNLF